MDDGMTRGELAALFSCVVGLRLRQTELDTLLIAVDNYVDNCLRIADRTRNGGE